MKSFPRGKGLGGALLASFSTPTTHSFLPREGKVIWIQLVNLGEGTESQPEFVMGCRASEEPVWELRVEEVM